MNSPVDTSKLTTDTPKIDTSYTPALPQEVKDQLCGIKSDGLPTQSCIILAILSQNETACLNDFVIGTYNVTKKTLKRNTLFSHLGRMKRQNLIDQPDKQIYQLTERGRDYCKSRAFNQISIGAEPPNED